MQNLVVVSHRVCALVVKIWDAGPRLLGFIPIKHAPLTRVILPDFVALCQIILE